MRLSRVLPVLLLLALSLPLAKCGFFDFVGGLFGSSKKSSSSSSSTAGLAPVSDDKAKSYLQSFGYVEPGNSLSSSPGGLSEAFDDAKTVLKKAIAKFQAFAGLTPTGELDTETKVKMAAPRCGDPDVLAISSGGPAFKWQKNRLTYAIESYSSDLPKSDIRRAISEAYGAWAAVTPLEINEVSAGQGADIKVRFASGSHSDPWPFDGKGGVLAHATMPENGALHFDDAENWVYMDAKKIDSNQYTDLLNVAIHEAGHTLGLSHSRDENSIMAPFYQRTTDDNGNYIKPTLKSTDINAIQEIYGRGSGGGSVLRPDPGMPMGGGNFGGGIDIPSRPRTTTTTPSPPRLPDRGSGGGSSSDGSGGFISCPVTADALTPAESGKAYLFSGSRVFEINTATRKINEQFSFIQLFPNGPPYVQAAVYNPVNSIMLLFQGRRVWGFFFSRLRGRFQLDAEYPKRLPADVDFVPSGALRWINGHQILLGDGGEFVVYDEYWNQVTLRNRVSAYFPNMPNGVKGILPPQGDYVIGFTLTRVFEYNARTRQTNSELRMIRDVLQCKDDTPSSFSSFFARLSSDSTSSPFSSSPTHFLFFTLLIIPLLLHL